MTKTIQNRGGEEEEEKGGGGVLPADLNTSCFVLRKRREGEN